MIWFLNRALAAYDATPACCHPFPLNKIDWDQNNKNKEDYFVIVIKQVAAKYVQICHNNIFKVLHITNRQFNSLIYLFSKQN